jgi:hypothetical protein
MEISLRVPSPQDDFDGLKHDQRVEADGGMLDIEKIVIFRAPPEACCRTCNAPVPIPFQRPHLAVQRTCLSGAGLNRWRSFLS